MLSQASKRPAADARVGAVCGLYASGHGVSERGRAVCAFHAGDAADVPSFASFAVFASIHQSSGSPAYFGAFGRDNPVLTSFATFGALAENDLNEGTATVGLLALAAYGYALGAVAGITGRGRLVLHFSGSLSSKAEESADSAIRYAWRGGLTSEAGAEGEAEFTGYDYSATLTAAANPALLDSVRHDTVSADAASDVTATFPADHYVWTPPAVVTPGVPFSVGLYAVTAGGFTCLTYARTADVVTSDLLGVPSTPVGFTAGVTGFPVTLNTVGTATLTATEQVDPSITGTSANIPVSPLWVDSFFPHDDGFSVVFNRAPNLSVLNLYANASGGYGAADMTVWNSAGSATGSQRGSLVVSSDHKTWQWVKTGLGIAARASSLLADETYTVTLKSGASAFKEGTGLGLLDGNADGTPGDDYTHTFTIAHGSPAQLFVPSFARGPSTGTAINVPNATGAPAGMGLPVFALNCSGATSAHITLSYDSTCLTVTGANANTTLAGSPTFTLSGSSTPGSAILDWTGAALTNTLTRLGGIVCSVPDAAPYKDKRILQVHNSVTSLGSVLSLSAVQVIGYLGDCDGDTLWTAADVTACSNIGSTSDGCLTGWRFTDAFLICDVNVSNSVNAADTGAISTVSTGGTNVNIPQPVKPGSFVFGGVD